MFRVLSFMINCKLVLGFRVVALGLIPNGF